MSQVATAEGYIPRARAGRGRAQGVLLRLADRRRGGRVLRPVPAGRSSTSFKTIPDSVSVTHHPAPVDDVGVGARSGTTTTSRRTSRTACSSRSSSSAATSSLAGLGGYAFARLQLPRPRVALPARARDADGPRSAAAHPGVRDAHELAPDRQLLRLHPHQPRHCHEPLPDAAVLPHHPEGLRGGGEARRRRLLQDVLARDAAARAARHLDARDPAVPGHVERLLLAVDPVRPGKPEPLHGAARARGAALHRTRPCGRRSAPAASSPSSPILAIFLVVPAVLRRAASSPRGSRDERARGPRSRRPRFLPELVASRARERCVRARARRRRRVDRCRARGARLRRARRPALPPRSSIAR